MVFYVVALYLNDLQSLIHHLKKQTEEFFRRV